MMDWEDSVQILGSFRIKHNSTIDQAKNFVGSTGRALDHSELRKYCYHRLEILAAGYIGAAWFMYYFCINYFSLSLDNLEAGGNQSMVLATSIPLLIVIVWLVFVATIFSFEDFSDFCHRNYNTLLSVSVLACFSAMLYASEMQEIRRALFQPTPSFEYINWGIEFSSFTPVRRCNDTDPMRTLTNRTDESPVGCNSLILNGTTFCFYILVLLLPSSLRMDHQPSMITAADCCLLYLAALFSTGTNGLVMISAVLFQAACAAVGSYLCYIRITS